MQQETTPAIYWLKRDFRLADNPALTTALAENATVTPLYILEDAFLAAPETSEFHVHAVTNALTDFRAQVRKATGKVAVTRGDVIEVFSKLHAQQPFEKIYSHEEIGVDRTYQRDIALRNWCDEHEVKWIELPQTGVFRAFNDRDIRHKFWKEFTFAELLPKPAAADLQRLQLPNSWVAICLPQDQELRMEDTNYKLTAAQRQHVQPVSEAAAELTLQTFLYDRGIHYSGNISSPLTAFVAGSRMSVHFAWGTMTGRQVYQRTQARKEELKEVKTDEAKRWRRSLTSFLSRLHWRDHFIQRLETEPQMEFEALNQAYEELEYIDDDNRYMAWCNGQTGFPMVDACVRCLQTTGFINFRMRAMLVSVACHTLQIDWKKLDHPMARWYTDYEPGIHISQLQMQASVVGINTIRMYSPNKQIIDQDPEAIFIKKWVPELREFTAKQIIDHRAESLGDYPPQLVDWWKSSRAMKDKLWVIRKKEETKAIAQQVYQKHGSRRGPRTRRKTTKKKKTE